LRRALPRIRQELALDSGGLRAFLFRLDAPSGGWPDPADVRGALLIPLSAGDRATPKVEPGLLFADDREALDRVLAIARTREVTATDRLH